MLGEGCHLTLLTHYSCYWRSIKSTRPLLGDCATTSDHVVIYGINLDYDHELKMQSRPQPGLCRVIFPLSTVKLKKYHYIL